MNDIAALDVGDGMVATATRQAGEGVLWIHGYTLDSRVWYELWEQLPGWRHLGVDLPGHGRSDPLAPGTDLVRLAKRLGLFAIDQDVRHLVGLSFGGMIALQIAIEYCHAFSSLVLGAPALAGGPQDRHAQARNLELAQLYRSCGPSPKLRDLWMTSPPDIFKGAAKNPALWQRLRAIVGDHRWTELADLRMQALTTVRQTENDLKRVEASTLVLIGDEDTAAFKRCSELIHRGIPHCRRVYLENTGHLTLLEQVAAVQPLIDAHFRSAVRLAVQ